MIRSLSKSISSIGQSDDNSDSLNREIFVLNNIIKLQIPLALIGTFGELYINHTLGGIVYSIVFLAAFLVLYLNKTKHYRLAKVITVFLPVVSVYSTLLISNTLRFAYYISYPIVFLALSTLGSVLFSTKKDRFLYYFSNVVFGIVIIGNSFFLDAFFGLNFIKDVLNGNALPISIVLSITYIASVGGYMFFHNISNRQKRLLDTLFEKLNAKNGLLEVNKQELEQKIIELNETQKGLEITQKKIENILSSINKGNIIINYNLKGEITNVNRRMLSLIESPRLTDDVKQRLNLRLWMSDLEFFTFIDAMKEGNIVPKSLDFLKKRKFHSLNLSFSPVFDKSDNLVEILAIGQDHSELIIKQRTIENQAAEIKKQSNVLLDSMNYARRIQDSMMETSKNAQQTIRDHFVLNKPKQIISGDFYWMHELDKKVLVGVFDCTGHGIPGGLVSIIGQQLLNRSVNEFGLTMPDEILNKTNELIKEELNHDIKDGMDASLVLIDYENNMLHFSGAYNPITIVSDKTTTTIKGDKFPIGKHWNSDINKFTLHTIPFNGNEKIYLYTDGFKDQFGGKNDRKIGSQNFYSILESTSNMDLDQQKSQLGKHFADWKGQNEQIDDVLVMGIEL